MSARRKLALEIVTEALKIALAKDRNLLWDSPETLKEYGCDIRGYWTNWMRNALTVAEACLEESGKYLEKP